MSMLRVFTRLRTVWKHEKRIKCIKYQKKKKIPIALIFKNRKRKKIPDVQKLKLSSEEIQQKKNPRDFEFHNRSFRFLVFLFRRYYVIVEKKKISSVNVHLRRKYLLKKCSPLNRPRPGHFRPNPRELIANKQENKKNDKSKQYFYSALPPPLPPLFLNGL